VDDVLKFKDWQCPAFEEDPAKRQGWIDEQISDGDNWWNSQAAAANADANVRLLSCDGPQKLKSNSLKSDIRKFVETISDIREIGTLGSGAEQFKDIVNMYNMVFKHIYHAASFARQSRKALQYAIPLARGYLWPRYIRKEFGWGQGGMEFRDLGPREVLPSQLPADNDMQGCYAQTICDCLGIAEAHARFPSAQEELLPISRTKPTSNGHVRRLEFWDRWKYGEQQGDWDQRYCEIRWSFVRDLRINRTGRTLEMGDWGERDGTRVPLTSWSYPVPSVGSLIVTTNPDNGLPESRTAKEEDCRLYPQLRLLLTNPGMSRPLYDGPAYDWHGIMPAVAYEVDDWPWMAVGFSLLNDVAGIERAERGFIDLMYRVLKIKMNPPMGYDLNAGIPREDLKHFQWLDEDGTKVGVDGKVTDALKSLLPDSVRVEEGDFKMVELFEKLRQKALGLNDLASLEKLKFNLSGETADKLLETLGPLAKGISANMQVAQGKIAEMLKYDVAQYYTTRDLLSFIGPDAVSVQTFDFDPNSIVPSHMPWEEKLRKENKPSEAPKMERAKIFVKNLKVISVPSQLLNVTQMQDQLKWLNFLQRGFPVSYSTAFKKLGVENWGDSPGATEFDKWQWEQVRMEELKIKAAQIVAASGLGGGDEKGGKGGQGKGGGRPPTAKTPPKQETRGTKSGNLRVVTAQSK
jgi:hypothetical protein